MFLPLVLAVTGVRRPEPERWAGFCPSGPPFLGEGGTGRPDLDLLATARSSEEAGRCRESGLSVSSAVPTSAERVRLLIPGSELADFCTPCPCAWNIPRLWGDCPKPENPRLLTHVDDIPQRTLLVTWGEGPLQ